MSSREIDDSYHRITAKDSYKNNRFAGKKTTTDDYTGETIYFGNDTDAQRLHGINKTSDVDHITPIAKVEDRYSDLTIEQQRTLANNQQYNYAMTNSHLNRSKGELENHEYLLRQIQKGESENLNTSTRMLFKEAKSRSEMAVQATYMRVENTAEEVNAYIYETSSTFLSENIAQINAIGLEQAESAALFAAAMSIGRNSIAVLKGDEKLNDAVKNSIKDTTTAAVLGYAKGALSHTLGIETGPARLVVNGTIQLSRLLTDYANGNIDEAKLVEEIAETSVMLTATYIGGTIGAAIGSVAGPIGIAAGQWIGETISTAVCTTIISSIKESKEFDKYNSRVISLYHSAEREIKESQVRLEALIQKDNDELKENIRIGFEKLSQGIIENDYSMVESGLAVIGEKFGITSEDFQNCKVTKETLFNQSLAPIVFD